MPRLIFLFCFLFCASISSYSSVNIPPNVRVHLFSDRTIQEIKIQGVGLELEVYKSGKVEKINLDKFNVIVEKNKLANYYRSLLNGINSLKTASIMYHPISTKKIILNTKKFFKISNKILPYFAIHW